MCGIAGLVFDKLTDLPEGLLQALSEPIKHRGPDDYGWCVSGPMGVYRGQSRPGPLSSQVILVHRRLAILDLSEAGRQPMATILRDYAIVHNGEIYNYLELRAELEKLGYVFCSQTDTEVLLYGYVEWGVDVLRRSVGMFAFAILDRRARKLILARDFFGIKPLYYTRCRDGFAFASEIKPLLNLPGVSRKVNPHRLYEYLRSGLTDHGSETLFADIHQVPAAHYLELSLDNPCDVQPKRFWEIDPGRRCELPFAQAAQRLREIFLESVQFHLRSDVPVGAALSGGIDSSSIVMAMRHINPDQTIHTFSYLADDPVLNEERWVDIIGASAQTIVHKVASEPEQLIADLEHLVEAQGEPFGSTSIYSQHRVFQAARSAGIKVMLDGQGADELLGGYEFYTAARIASLLEQGKWGDAFRLWHKSSQIPRKNRLWQYLGKFLFPFSLQDGLRCLIGREMWPAWLNRSWFVARGVAMEGHSYGTDVLREELIRTLVRTSLPMLLRYEDRNSMAYSIESRVPFLTPQLVEFVLSLPEEHIIAADGTSKAVFRKAMRGIVPDAVLDRNDKIGFETPEKQWLCNGLRNWVERLLTSEEIASMTALNGSMLKLEWQAILNGVKRFDNRVWRWVNLAVWTRLNGVRFD
ncbi:MAG TPA: asparagine synthase (glutamine-hydrolyzing) [Syntrophobacteraceae bacterium]|nr:asparagine synthase (glutamine-hydrolyzing) [Syntrophobacteraceae bacterium]